jgi:hypothetical protein
MISPEIDPPLSWENRILNAVTWLLAVPGTAVMDLAQVALRVGFVFGLEADDREGMLRIIRPFARVANVLLWPAVWLRLGWSRWRAARD